MISYLFGLSNWNLESSPKVIQGPFPPWPSYLVHLCIFQKIWYLDVPLEGSAGIKGDRITRLFHLNISQYTTPVISRWKPWRKNHGWFTGKSHHLFESLGKHLFPKASVSGWWQLKYFLCLPRNLGKWWNDPILLVFFKGVGWNHQLVHFGFFSPIMVEILCFFSPLSQEFPCKKQRRHTTADVMWGSHIRHRAFPTWPMPWVC